MCKKYLPIALCVALLYCSGCAKKPVQEDIVTANYYPACHEPLAYLKQRHEGTGSNVAKGAIQGGVISGIASAIVGAIAGNMRPAAILTSVGVGAVIGGGASAMTQAPGQREDNKKMAEYLEQIDGDISGMDIVQAAATVSMQCYGREYKKLLDDLQEMPDDAAKQRLAEILAGREEAAKLLHQQADNATYEQDFQKATAKIYQRKTTK